MFSFRRVLAVGGFLAVAVIITCSHVWGDPGRDKDKKDSKDGNKVEFPKTVDPREARDARSPFSSREFSKFSDQPVLVYKTTADDFRIALQLKPDLPDVAARPCDYLVMIDTSASKSAGYFAAAQQLAETLIQKMGPNDRLALWTANVEARSLTKKEFLAKNQLGDAVRALAKEYPSGAVNLKKGLDDVIASFEGGASRQRVILFLGDGNSTAGPLDGDSRSALADKMVKREIAFFTVPLGLKPYFANLHGFVNATGGKVIRVEEKDKPGDTVDRFVKAVAVPILYPQAFELPAEVTEAFPTKLPPLRRDTSTLVAGKMSKPLAKIAYKITGTLAGKEISVPVSLPMPPADVDNFFLANVVNQWREHKDRPALLQADRTLAYAHDENEMARSKLVADADWALENHKYDHAYRLYKQALAVDPHDSEAKAGLRLVDDLKSGKIKPEQLRKDFEKAANEDKITRIAKGLNGKSQEQFVKHKAELLGQGDAPKPVDPPNFNPPAVEKPDILQEAKARQAVADQEANAVVADVIRRANRLVRTEPDAAHTMIKRTLEGVQTNPDLSPTAQLRLTEQLRTTLEYIDRTGASVKQAQADGSALAAIADARANRERLVRATQNQVKERIKAFDALMQDARYEMAFFQAREMQSEMIEHGQQVPTALVAAYNIAQPAKHLAELHRLARIREEKWLDTYLEVERTFMPQSDEPPIIFPTPSQIRKLTIRYDGSSQFDNWKDWSEYRINKYAASTFGDSMPERGLKLRDALSQPVTLPIPAEWTLGDALDYLTDKYNLTFDIYDRAFADEQLKDVRGVNIAPGAGWQLKDVSLATVLKKLLAKVPVNPSEATYIIRREAIEITTSRMAAYEKVVRVYPVADLLQYLNGGSNTGGATFFGAAAAGFQQGFQGGFQAGFAGLQAGGFQAGFAGLQAGGFQAGFAGLQAGGFQAGFAGLQAGGFQAGFAGLQAGGFQAGFAGLQAGGFQAGFAGLQAGGFQAGLAGLQAGFQAGLAGLQAGGFQAGFAGLQAGGFQAGLAGLQAGGFQAGLAGLQAGFQSGFQAGGAGSGLPPLLRQSAAAQQLIQLIRNVVGRTDEWQSPPQYNPTTGMYETNPPLGPDGQPRPLLPGEELNNIVYFAPAQAIIVKGTSRITPRFRPPFPVQPGAVGGDKPEAKLDPPKRDPLALGNKDPKTRVLGDDDKKQHLDPKTIWEDALTKGVEDPGIIIAVADFLGQIGRWDHVAEFLKADLRKGIVVKPWVYESLAMALRNVGAPAEEIERAELSALDLQPTDAQGYLKAAQAMADLKHYDRALAFCKQASLLEPNTPFPYADALTYADASDDLNSLEWATSNLLKQDWAVNNDAIQKKAKSKLEAMAERLDKKNRTADSKKLRETVESQRRRDLVIKLSWEGEADLDLKVKEPSGSTCWALNRMTVGGGTLVGDTLSDMHHETYMAAEAYSGDYQITVDRVWGHPKYDKARLVVIRNQGTTEEMVSPPMTVDLSQNKPIPLKLDSGRRTEAAYVPPPASQQTPDASLVPQSKHDLILAQLRDLADPETYTESKGFRSGFGSPGASLAEKPAPVSGPSANDKVLYQTRVSSFISNSLDVTAQAVLSADRRSISLKVSPVFAPLAANAPDPKVTTSVIP